MAGAESTAADLFTPWDEPARVVERHVGRGRELTALVDASARFLAGAPALPIYVFGPRGVGKSHLLTVFAERVRGAWAAAGGVVVASGEDLPEYRDATALLERVLGRSTTPWASWFSPVEIPAGQPTLLLLEGLDRQLKALGVEGRRTLRRLLAAHPEVFVVATGTTLCAELTGTDEAFRGHFDPWPLSVLAPEESTQLLTAAVGDAMQQGSAWEGRGAAALVLGAGNPRALLALAAALRADPDRSTAEALGMVLSGLTAHYQWRLRDLSPTQQQIVDLLARAPRELGAVDLAEALRAESGPTSTQCRRLLDEGVLLDRAEGHRTYFRIAEPLFRYWLEYRLAPWEDARTAWMGRLIEALWTPREEAGAPAQSRPPEAGLQALLMRLLGSPREAAVLARRVAGQLAEAARGPLHAELEELRRALAPAPHPAGHNTNL